MMAQSSDPVNVSLPLSSRCPSSLPSSFPFSLPSGYSLPSCLLCLLLIPRCLPLSMSLSLTYSSWLFLFSVPFLLLSLSPLLRYTCLADFLLSLLISFLFVCFCTCFMCLSLGLFFVYPVLFIS